MATDCLEGIRESKVEVRKVDRGGAVVTYRVSIGVFSLDVLMLNIAQPAQTIRRKLFAKGTFGEIFDASSADRSEVIKRITFRRRQIALSEARNLTNWQLKANYGELQNILIEYGFCRICSALGVGPKVRTFQNFDVVCYDNAAQFLLEKCKPLQSQPLDEIEPQLLYCLKVMHTFKLIHKDIKPANIMYSPSLQNFVLLDFGVSTYLKEEIGFKTLTHREGTYRYMSLEMQ
jgi:serine/threonine protein kinase